MGGGGGGGICKPSCVQVSEDRGRPRSFPFHEAGIVFLIWKPYIPVLASPPSPSLQAYSFQ